MKVLLQEAKGILTPQRGGFLSASPYPFTHALSPYVGCGFGQTTCGMYCYAQYLPSWSIKNSTADWGKTIQVKVNAAELLEESLSKMKTETRKSLRLFMSSTTDPYQPVEQKYQLTRRCLKIFSHYHDLDLLVLQTRSPLAIRDLPLLRNIAYAWLSVTIETDDQQYLMKLRGGPSLEKRWKLVREASSMGINTQITVSPCLPYRDLGTFGTSLLQSGAKRIVVDTFVDGDGSGGRRTSHTSFAKVCADWMNSEYAQLLYGHLCAQKWDGVEIGWSSSGFCGIKSSHSTPIIPK